MYIASPPCSLLVRSFRIISYPFIRGDWCFSFRKVSSMQTTSGGLGVLNKKFLSCSLLFKRLRAFHCIIVSAMVGGTMRRYECQRQGTLVRSHRSYFWPLFCLWMCQLLIRYLREKVVFLRQLCLGCFLFEGCQFV